MFSWERRIRQVAFIDAVLYKILRMEGVGKEDNIEKS
jgi:hypothetical protein